MTLSTAPNGSKVGVVLFQLGGPDSLEAVEPFLYNLFSDPDIIDFPFARIAREPLARLVAAHRARKVRHAYSLLGGSSPINEITRQQATALERELRREMDARVVVAMRYWHPLTEEAIAALEPDSLAELVLLPLYPQYSKVTTGSSLNEWNRRYSRAATHPVPLHVVPHFYNDPHYIEAVAERIDQALEQFAGSGQVELIFSAHSIPADVAAQGDPYKPQVEATMELVMRRGGWAHPYRLCYQSKVGPGRWLQPSLDATLRQLAAQRAQNLLVIPISFVSEHIETLREIDAEARALAQGLGIRRFALMPALNDSPKFIQALAELVRDALRAQPAAAGNIP